MLYLIKAHKNVQLIKIEGFIIIIIISINQIDTCHTTNIFKGGWFIYLFKKH